MPHPSFLPRITTLVALAAFGAPLGPAAPAGSTPVSAQLLPGDFDPRKALELVYGKLETAGDAALWKPSDEVRKAPWNTPDWDSIRVSALAALAFRQEGAERRFLVVQLVPGTGDGYRCHACEPGIGAATFTKTAEGWRLDARSLYVTNLGSDGTAPAPEIVKVGPERYGLVFHTVYVGQGQTYSGATYFLETGASVNEAIQLETGYDNSGVCGEGLDPCEGVISTLEFVPGKDPEYYDLKVTSTSTPDGGLQGETLYSYVGGKYQEAKQAHAESTPESHCTESEVAVFYCGIDDKNLSVCQLDDGQVSYRFGKLGAPEITIDSVATLSSRPYPGGGESRLRFSRGGYDYLVYDLIRHSGVVDEETGLRGFEDRAGVHVLKVGKRIATLDCTGWLEGNSGKVLSYRLKSKQKEDFVDLD